MIYRKNKLKKVKIITAVALHRSLVQPCYYIYQGGCSMYNTILSGYKQEVKGEVERGQKRKPLIPVVSALGTLITHSDCIKKIFNNTLIFHSLLLAH